MNTFKKIAAVVMAAATLATTMISVSAYALRPYYMSWHNQTLTPIYQYQFKEGCAQVPEIYTSEMENAGVYTRVDNDVTFKKINGSISDGKMVLHIRRATQWSVEKNYQHMEEALRTIGIYDNNGVDLCTKYNLVAVPDYKGGADILSASGASIRSAYEREKFEYIGYGIFEHTFSLERMALVGVPELKVDGKSIGLHPRSDFSVQHLGDRSERPSTTITYRFYLDPSELNEYKSVTVNGIEVDRLYCSEK